MAFGKRIKPDGIIPSGLSLSLIVLLILLTAVLVLLIVLLVLLAAILVLILLVLITVLILTHKEFPPEYFLWYRMDSVCRKL